MRQARIAIVGAGPAGLTAALAARRLGLEAEVFEQAQDFKRVGGGVLMHSNGQRVLAALGVLAGFEPRMRLTQKMAVELPGARRLSEADYARVPVPFNRAAVVLRYELQEHLLAAAAGEGVRVRFGMRCEGFVREGSGAVLRFADGSAHGCDVVLACDGIHSRVREGAGLPFEKRALGEAYVRAVADRRTEDPTIREVLVPDGRRFGICPLPGDRTYFFCSVPLGGWKERVAGGGVPAWIESWGVCGEEVLGILRAVPDWTRASYDELHEVRVERWAKAPVFVTGDAAHAMTPNLGQGANSAMVDALVVTRMLAPALGDGSSLEAVASAYDALRRPFVTRIQGAARRAGAAFGLSFGPARWTRDAVFRATAQVPAIGRPALLLMAGYQKAEEEFFAWPGQ